MKKIMCVLLLIVAMGCGKDVETVTSVLLQNETISGTVVYEDDKACCTGLTVSIIKSTITNPTPEVLSTVDVGFDGKYIFDNILPGQEDLYITLNGGSSIVTAKDDTPDGDELEGDAPGVIWIGVFLEENENDDGNNFVIRVQECAQSLILGHVYAVTGEDTTSISESITVNLYSSDIDGNLLALFDTRLTDGFISFPVDNGLMATLEIDYSSTTLMPIAISLADETPDGDPTSGIEVTHLPVHVDSCEVDSDNNIYLFFDDNSSGCQAMPMIFPYPALCDTSIICAYDQLPIFVIDEQGQPITTAGGIYQLQWTDLLTGQSQPGDWAYHSTNHPMQLEITYPDGCIYTVNYHRECEQDLSGQFSMRTMTTGFGPIYDYDVGEINWTFSPFSNALIIEYNIMNMVSNPNLVPEGEYTYAIMELGSSLELNIEDPNSGMTYNLGEIRFANGQVILDDDIAADGVGRFFEKN